MLLKMPGAPTQPMRRFVKIELGHMVTDPGTDLAMNRSRR